MAKTDKPNILVIWGDDIGCGRAVDACEPILGSGLY